MPGNLWLSSIGRHCRMGDRTTSRPAVQGAGPAPVHVSGLELQACLRDQRRADEVKAAFNGEVKRSMGGRRVHEGATTRFLVAIRSWQTTRLDWELQKAKCAMFWGGNLVHAFTTQVESMMVTFKSRAPRLTDLQQCRLSQQEKRMKKCGDEAVDVLKFRTMRWRKQYLHLCWSDHAPCRCTSSSLPTSSPTQSFVVNLFAHCSTNAFVLYLHTIPYPEHSLHSNTENAYFTSQKKSRPG